MSAEAIKVIGVLIAAGIGLAGAIYMYFNTNANTPHSQNHRKRGPNRSSLFNGRKKCSFCEEEFEGFEAYQLSCLHFCHYKCFGSPIILASYEDNFHNVKCLEANCKKTLVKKDRDEILKLYYAYIRHITGNPL